MKEKINDILSKLGKIAVSVRDKLLSSKLVLWSSVAVAVLLIVLVVVIVASPDDAKAFEWGTGVTEGIPSFATEENKLESDGNYMTAYYKSVEPDAASEYIAKLENDCGIRFASYKYPRSAIYNDKIIVVHYDEASKNLSVTVSLKGDNAKKEISYDNQELD